MPAKGDYDRELARLNAELDAVKERTDKLYDEILGSNGEGLKVTVAKLTDQVHSMRRVSKIAVSILAAMFVAYGVDMLLKLTGVAYGGYMESFDKMTKALNQNNDKLEEIGNKLEKRP